MVAKAQEADMKGDGRRILAVEYDARCEPCEGTGVYVGLAERAGSAVVCHTCKGRGGVVMRHEYSPFDGTRDIRGDVSRVFAHSVGIVTGGGMAGGASYQEWLRDPAIVKERGRELRAYACPAWWYQIADTGKKPQWEECIPAGRFSECPHFCDKAACWERFDAEQAAAEGATP